MKKFFGVLVASALLFGACSGVSTQSANQSENNIVNQQQNIYNKVQPVPLYDFSQDRNTLIQIYNAKNEARQTWTVVFSNSGVPLWSCPSFGFPIPTTTQLTNPEAPGNYGSYGSYTLPQAEPNGLYTGTSMATYFICLRPNGDKVPMYAEPLVMAFPFEVKIINGQVVDSGTGSTMTLNVQGGTSSVAPITPASTPAPSK